MFFVITGTVSTNNVRHVGNRGITCMIVTFDSLEGKRTMLKSARRLRSSMI